MTVKSGQLYRSATPGRKLRGQGSNLHEPVSRTGELPITRPRTGAWRRARTADFRVTRAMLWQLSYPGMIDSDREPDSNWRLREPTARAAAPGTLSPRRRAHLRASPHHHRLGVPDHGRLQPQTVGERHRPSRGRSSIAHAVRVQRRFRCPCHSDGRVPQYQHVLG